MVYSSGKFLYPADENLGESVSENVVVPLARECGILRRGNGKSCEEERSKEKTKLVENQTEM